MFTRARDAVIQSVELFSPPRVNLEKDDSVGDANDQRSPDAAPDPELEEESFLTENPTSVLQVTIPSMLDHLMFKVMKLVPGDPIVAALDYNRVGTIDEILLLERSDIDTLDYRDGNLNLKKLSLSDRVMLSHVRGFHDRQCTKCDEPYLDDKEWKKLESVDWSLYLIERMRDKLEERQVADQRYADLRAHELAVSSSKKERSLAESFIYGIKKDISHYPVFKEAKFWDAWDREIKSKAYLHECADVLDGAYVPEGKQEIELFALKKTFMYAMLMDKVQHPDAINIVRGETDAQKCYQALVHRFRDSAQALLDAQGLRQQIMEMKLDKSWKGTPVKFLQVWCQRVAQLDATVDNPLVVWPPEARKAQLISAVSYNSDLARLMDMEMLNMALDKKTLSYESYLTLLETSTHATASRPGASQNTRNVNSVTQKLTRKQKQKTNAATRVNAGSTSFERIADDVWNKMTPEQRTAVVKKRREARRKVNSAEQTVTHTVNSTVVQSDVAAMPTYTVQTSSTPAHQGIIQQATTQHTPEVSSADIRSIMSSMRARGQTQSQVVVDNVTCNFSIQALRIYRMSHSQQPKYLGALMDSGANGGMAGRDLRVLAETGGRAQIEGIAGNLSDLQLVTAAGVIETTQGPVIGIFHQYAHYPEGKTIHSVPQWEAFNITVDCRSRKRGGLQRVSTPDGFTVPLHVRQGLSYMDMRPPTDTELESLTHVAFTSDVEWDPGCLDDETDLGVYNKNLDEDEVATHHPIDLELTPQWSNTGEGTQRVIRNFHCDPAVGECRDGRSVLDRDDMLQMIKVFMGNSKRDPRN